MIKVLAAEMSDQGRLSRGKRYWADGAVIDIVVGHGSVTAEVQGSRREPYVVTLETDGGSGVPSKRELWVQCTCPEDTGMGSEACKHAVAALFTLSDEVAIEPELVDRWRQGRRGARGDNVTALADRRVDDDANQENDDETVGSVNHDDVGEVIPFRPRYQQEREHPVDDDLRQRASLLRAPEGADAPDLPDVEPIVHGGIRDRTLADMLDDALDHLAIRWE
jgi:uncharacterized Zn finger protein